MTKEERTEKNVEAYYKLALQYKKQYKETSWWKFKKRRELKSMWDSALYCMIKYS